MHGGKAIRLAALADLHFGKAAQGTLKPLFAQIAEAAEILLLCGDLTDYVLPEEAHLLGQALSAAGMMPIVAVLGNHDFESGKQEEIGKLLAAAGVHVLDGDTCEIHGIGFAGTKGFGGGFGQRVLAPWGEEMVKRYVQE